MEIVDEQRIADVRAALDRGELVVVPTDTVYGLASRADDEAAVRRMYEVKGRALTQPTAALFASVPQLLDAATELDARTRYAIQALLPGPWTLIVDAPALAWPWLTGGTPGAPIGVRVPAGALDLPPIAATSANPSGAPTAASFAQLDDELVEHVTFVVDRGVLDPAGESTVLDLTDWARRDGDGEIRVLRDTAGRAGHALAVLAGVPAQRERDRTR